MPTSRDNNSYLERACVRASRREAKSALRYLTGSYRILPDHVHQHPMVYYRLSCPRVPGYPRKPPISIKNNTHSYVKSSKKVSPWNLFEIACPKGTRFEATPMRVLGRMFHLSGFRHPSGTMFWESFGYPISMTFLDSWRVQK